ncbi:hypothetical protein [uncultured Pseudokineococcus sp.]|uniref:hypothetical protein n=1 Tax=uncultured Pseudokineococcus sp. TaxID=1642928 RepID=UPI00261F99FA|nr:hypothetical protein [uncultured Pseudokineococcus sp.]
MTSTPSGGSVEDAQRELRRCLDRLAALGPGRVVRPGPRSVGAEALGAVQARPPADVVRAALQQLADVAADLGGRPRRAVPELAPHALGDQLAVLAADVLAAADARDDAAVVVALRERLVALRRAL